MHAENARIPRGLSSDTIYVHQAMQQWQIEQQMVQWALPISNIAFAH